MALLPYTMASSAGKRMLAGARGMARPGAAIGAAAGGIHGAVTNDPNNPNEGRVGRILSGALGGAAMGAGAGALAGGAKAHVGNLTRAATNKGRVQGFVGGMAVGAGAGRVSGVAKGVMDRAGAAQASATRRASKVQGQQVVHPGGAPIAAKGTVQPHKDPYYDKSSQFYGGPEQVAPGQSSPSLVQRAKSKVQDIRQNRAASHAAEQEARDFAERGQWKTSSPSFWAGFVSRSNGEI